ncbi:hypothetical protein LS66_002650 [Helicobacter sp. MIT 03-1614]|uniref:hypothetical protein n=1 Tax=Helicobacter sp. MIT 03-1614 TaxID=1548147 RepID=UPI0005136EC2|nr:hypothetical protein [Helicobacter sp. MIT 03-1614]TLD90388.1 hypothetical protein LS66_002650 [Helicobacter sp. MIT 03-1614]
MKSLVALGVFLLFLSVSYGEEYKCLSYEGNTCVYFESEAKYDTIHLHCKNESIKREFKYFNDIVSVTIDTGNEGIELRTGSEGRYYSVYMGGEQILEKDTTGTYYLNNPEKPTDLGKKIIAQRIEAAKARVKERDEFLKLLLDNNLCKIVEF